MGRDATSATPEELLAEIEWVRRVARALVGRDDSDEVVQQTYLQAISRPPASGPIRSWLRTVLRNVVRRQARDEATRALHERIAPPAAPVLEPDETVARAELHRAVVDAVLALEEPYRRSLLLRFLEEREVAAIAGITNSPEATVRTRIRRGLEQVREALQARATRGGGDAAAAQALLFVRLSEFAGSAGGGAAGTGTAAGATTAATAVAAGGVVMSLAAKCVLAGAVVVAASFTIWIAGRTDAKSARTDVALSSAHPQIASATAEPAPSPAAAREQVPVGVDRMSAPPEAATTKPPVVTGVGGTLRGTVVDDLTGEPLEGADVWIVASKGLRDSIDDAARIADAAISDPKSASDRYAPAATLTTAADGFFECDHLSTFSDLRAISFDGRSHCAISDPIRFDESHATREVELRLVPTVILRGKVTDAEGASIIGAQVIVSRRSRKTGMSIQTTETRSSPEPGAWSLGPIVATSIDITAQMRGFELPPEKRHFDVTPDQHEIVVDFVLERSTATPVRGPIVDSTGTPIDLRQRLPALFGETSLEDCVRKHLSVEAIGGARPIPEVGSPAPHWYGKFDVTVAGALVPGQDGYEIVLPKQFTGTLLLIADGSVAGAALIGDSTHPPPLPFDISGVVPQAPRATLVVGLVDAATGVRIDLRCDEISVVPAIPQTPGYDARQARSPSGASVCECDVRVGRMIVSFARRGFVTQTAEVAVNDAGERRVVELPLVRATASIRGRIAIDEVTVEGVKGRPHVTVSVYAAAAQGFEAVTMVPIDVNEAGRFEIGGLAPQEYVVVAESYGSVPAVAHARAADPPPEIDLPMAHGEMVQFQVARPRRTYGYGDVMWRILDARGVPVVNSFQPGHQASNQQGHVGGTLAPGHYKALFWSPGCREATRDFDVPTGGLIEVQLERAR